MTNKKRVSLSCRVCMLEFSVQPYLKDRKYCSKKCQFSPLLGTYINCGNCTKLFRIPPSDVGKRRYCSYECRSNSSDYKKQCSISGVRRSQKHDYSGDSNPNWRGGTCNERHLAMSRKDYKDWRRSVYDRDGYKCLECGIDGDGKNLQADHIKPYSTHPELRLSVENGRTLCVDCHKKTDTYGWKMFNILRKRELV